MYGLLSHALLFFPVARSLSFFFSLSFFHFLFSWDRPGGGSGSRHEPLADSSRAQRTANRKGLYIISS